MTPADSAEQRRPNPILSMLGRGMQSALNHALDLDPDTRSHLQPLDGRALQLSFKGTGMTLRLRVDGERLIVGPGFEGPSGLHVTATPGSLLGMAVARLRGDAEASLPPGQVEISGDAELARRLQGLAARFQPDIDEAFCRAFGDVLGFQIARGFRRAIGAARDTAATLIRDGADYLVEESRDLVAKPELEQFLDDVDSLRERADRFAARVDRLQATPRR
jgi:ubiquinone biosynthesis protein UbiJ